MCYSAKCYGIQKGKKTPEQVGVFFTVQWRLAPTEQGNLGNGGCGYGVLTQWVTR